MSCRRRRYRRPARTARGAWRGSCSSASWPPWWRSGSCSAPAERPETRPLEGTGSEAARAVDAATTRRARGCCRACRRRRARGCRHARRRHRARRCRASGCDATGRRPGHRDHGSPVDDKTPVPGSAAGPDAKLEIECLRYQSDQKWAELDACAGRLMARNPAVAQKLKARVAIELKAKPRIDAFAAAMKANDLKKAKLELDAVQSSTTHGQLKQQYEQAEAAAIRDLVTRLEQVKERRLQEVQSSPPAGESIEAAARAWPRPRARSSAHRRAQVHRLEQNQVRQSCCGPTQHHQERSPSCFGPNRRRAMPRTSPIKPSVCTRKECSLPRWPVMSKLGTANRILCMQRRPSSSRVTDPMRTRRSCTGNECP